MVASGHGQLWSEAVIYSGLDWSGSPGKEHGPWLVYAMVHVDEADLATMDDELNKVRADLRLDQDFTFHHSETTPATKKAFFSALRRVPLSAHVYMLSKARWSAVYVSGSSGTDCIIDGIIQLIVRCPAGVVAEQILYIDLPRQEGKLVQHYRTTIRQALRLSKVPAFKRMKPRPDDREDAALIQIADMISGQVREHDGLAGPYLPALRAQITIV